MALDHNTVGQDIADFIKNNRPTGPASDAYYEMLWKGIMQIIYDDLKANADVKPGGFTAPPGGGPITGTGGPLE